MNSLSRIPVSRVRRFTIALLALGLLASGSAHAAPPRLAVGVTQEASHVTAPISYFNLHLRPGTVRSAGRVTITNREARPVTLDVAAVGAQTASNLGSAYDVAGRRKTGPMRWTRLSRPRLRVPSGRSVSLRVTVAVPARTRPGDYLSGVSIEARGQRRPGSASSGPAVASSQRFVVGVQVNVPGRRRAALRLLGASVERFPSGPTFLLRARNSGNTILKRVSGRMQVLRGRRVVASETIGPGTFVTGTRIEHALLARGERPVEGTRYRVRAVLRHPGGVARLDEVVTYGARQARRQEEFGAPGTRRSADGLPWWLIALALAAAGGFGGAATVATRRMRTSS